WWGRRIGEIARAPWSGGGLLLADDSGSRFGTIPADGRLAARGERPWLYAVFRAGSDQPRQRGAAQTGLDVPHRGAPGSDGQDDRVHADRRRRRDVRHHGIPPRRGPRRGDRPRALAVRSAQGISVRTPTDVGRRQSGMRPLVRRPVRRRAPRHPRHGGWAAVLPGREKREARPALRPRWDPGPPPAPRPEIRPARLWADVPPGHLA